MTTKPPTPKAKQMTLTDICTSLDLSKQLKEAGYPQESLFAWGKDRDFYSGEDKGWTIEMYKHGHPSGLISAPTSSELGEVLLKFAYKWQMDWTMLGIVYLPEENNNMSQGALMKLRNQLKRDIYHFDGKHYLGDLPTSEVNARAKMWLYLKKKGLI